MKNTLKDIFVNAYRAVHGAQGTPEITVEDLKKLIDGKEEFILLDVREQWEYETACIQGSTLIPLGELTGRMNELPKDKPLVVHCKMGGRSARAVVALKKAGFEKAVNLAGGIDAWAERIDTKIPRY